VHLITATSTWGRMAISCPGAPWRPFHGPSSYLERSRPAQHAAQMRSRLARPRVHLLIVWHHWASHGQVVVNCATWAVALGLWARADARVRPALLACLVFATAGEIFLSLVWGLYTYRLHNIPLFVPPGHVMMLMLGIALAQRISKRTADSILACAAAYALAAASTGIDTFALPLLAALAAIFWFRLGSGDPSKIPSALIGRQRRSLRLGGASRSADSALPAARITARSI